MRLGPDATRGYTLTKEKKYLKKYILNVYSSVGMLRLLSAFSLEPETYVQTSTNEHSKENCQY